MNHPVPTSPLITPAQTNTALFCQLHDAGHSTAEILRVQNAYRVCCKLFNGRYRKTERAFICHAVGTGSSVAFFDRRIDLIIAAMLHAAYDTGQFPDGRSGPTRRHREWLTGQVGPAVEQLVADYSQFDFEMGRPESLAEAGIPTGQADFVLIALAHEVDDLADGGLFLAPKYGRSIASRVAACAALARRLDQPRLAETLEGHAGRYTDVAWMAELGSARPDGFRIAPNLRSYLRLRRDHRRDKSVDVF